MVLLQEKCLQGNFFFFSQGNQSLPQIILSWDRQEREFVLEKESKPWTVIQGHIVLHLCCADEELR